jgi:hypothetical protein
MKRNIMDLDKWVFRQVISIFICFLLVGCNRFEVITETPNDIWMGCIGEPDPHAKISFDSIKFELANKEELSLYMYN